jgi:hypothetical protein
LQRLAVLKSFVRWFKCWLAFVGCDLGKAQQALLPWADVPGGKYGF